MTCLKWAIIALNRSSLLTRIGKTSLSRLQKNKPCSPLHSSDPLLPCFLSLALQGNEEERPWKRSCLYTKTLSEGTANGSCSYLLCKNNEFFAWRTTTTATQTPQICIFDNEKQYFCTCIFEWSQHFLKWLYIWQCVHSASFPGYIRYVPQLFISGFWRLQVWDMSTKSELNCGWLAHSWPSESWS